MNKVVVIKLSSGEVLACNIADDKSDVFLTVKNVARIVEVPPKREGDQMNVVMIPFMPFTKASLATQIGYNQIVFMVDPIDEIAEAHNNQFHKIKPGKPELFVQ